MVPDACVRAETGTGIGWSGNSIRVRPRRSSSQSMGWSATRSAPRQPRSGPGMALALVASAGAPKMALITAAPRRRPRPVPTHGSSRMDGCSSGSVVCIRGARRWLITARPSSCSTTYRVKSPPGPNCTNGAAARLRMAWTSSGVRMVIEQCIGQVLSWTRTFVRDMVGNEPVPRV